MYQINIRVDDSIKEKFDFICETYGLTRIQTFAEMVNSTYDSINGNPELVDVLHQMQALKDKLEGFKF